MGYNRRGAVLAVSAAGIIDVAGKTKSIIGKIGIRMAVVTYDIIRRIVRGIKPLKIKCCAKGYRRKS
jgi:hypothetical protein